MFCVVHIHTGGVDGHDQPFCYHTEARGYGNDAKKPALAPTEHMSTSVSVVYMHRTEWQEEQLSTIRGWDLSAGTLLASMGTGLPCSNGGSYRH